MIALKMFLRLDRTGYPTVIEAPMDQELFGRDAQMLVFEVNFCENSITYLPLDGSSRTIDRPLTRKQMRERLRVTLPLVLEMNRHGDRYGYQ